MTKFPTQHSRLSILLFSTLLALSSLHNLLFQELEGRVLSRTCPCIFLFISFIRVVSLAGKAQPHCQLSQCKSYSFQVQIKSKLFHEVFLYITINKCHSSYIPCIINQLCMNITCFKTVSSLRTNSWVSLSSTTMPPH